MTEHPNATLARTHGRRLPARRPRRRSARNFADDAVWDLPGRSAVAGEYKGPTPSSASWPRPTSCPAALCSSR